MAWGLRLSVRPSSASSRKGWCRRFPRFGYVVAPITVADVEDIYELRLILETSAVRLAAQRISSEELARLQAQSGFTYQYHNRQSYNEFLSRNTTFHAAVAAASGNKRLAQVVSKLLDDMTRIFQLGLDLRDSAAEMTREHLDLVGAIADHDADQAELLLRDQIVTSRQRVLERLADRINERFVGEAPILKVNRSDQDRIQGGAS